MYNLAITSACLKHLVAIAFYKCLLANKKDDILSQHIANLILDRVCFLPNETSNLTGNVCLTLKKMTESELKLLISFATDRHTSKHLLFFFNNFPELSFL